MKKFIKFTMFAYKDDKFEPSVIHGQPIWIEPNEIISIRSSSINNDKYIKKTTVGVTTSQKKDEPQNVSFSFIDTVRFSYSVTESIDQIHMSIEDFFRNNPNY